MRQTWPPWARAIRALGSAFAISPQNIGDDLPLETASIGKGLNSKRFLRSKYLLPWCLSLKPGKIDLTN
jgi:hypothetical protein